jgi:hypothetical protein
MNNWPIMEISCEDFITETYWNRILLGIGITWLGMGLMWLAIVRDPGFKRFVIYFLLFMSSAMFSYPTIDLLFTSLVEPRYLSSRLHRKAVFHRQWASIHRTSMRYHRQYCGGVASVMPGTSSVESYFFIINWTKDSHSKCLTDFSLQLEAILHCGSC